MPKALTDCVTQKQIALQTIPLIINTPKGSLMTYVITESETDQLVYSKFINSRYAHVFTSSIVEKNLQESCDNVEFIVGQLNVNYPNKIIGIRDKDYTSFSTTYERKENIFFTDGRDIEMMMFECSFVQEELQKLEKFDSKYRNSIEFARRIGYLRIANEKYKSGYSFKKNIKYNILLEARTGDVIPDALLALESQFITEQVSCSEMQFVQLTSELSGMNDKWICRGHDVIDMLSNYYRNITDKRSLELLLAVYYHEVSFKATTLYATLKEWAMDNNSKILEFD